MYDIFAQTQKPSGDCMYEFDGDEQFYVDLDREETVWGLQEFSTVYAFDAQEALPYIVSLKNNLRALIERHNVTQVPSGGGSLVSSSGIQWEGWEGPGPHSEWESLTPSAGGPFLDRPGLPAISGGLAAWLLFPLMRG